MLNWGLCTKNAPLAHIAGAKHAAGTRDPTLSTNWLVYEMRVWLSSPQAPKILDLPWQNEEMRRICVSACGGIGIRLDGFS